MNRALLSAALSAALLTSSAALAQSPPPKKPPPPPPPSAKDVIDSVSASPDVEGESKGNYPDMKREESLPLGQIQRAWDKAPEKDGVYHVEWSADKVIKLRVRQYIPVTIVFPEWETIGSEPESGDSFVFGAERVGSNKLVIRAKYVGADAAITVIGDSGNVYAFYIRAEGANSVNIPDVVVYVHTAPPTGGVVVGPTPQAHAKNAAVIGGPKSVDVASATRAATGEKSPDFAKGIPFDPSKLSFDFDMSGDASIAPKRVFSDGIFTWFDYGDRWDRSDLPAVYRVVDGVDTPVNTRVRGSMLVAEAAGAFTLRNGQRVVCVRPAGWEPEGTYAEPSSSPAPTGSAAPATLLGDDKGRG